MMNVYHVIVKQIQAQPLRVKWLCLKQKEEPVFFPFFLKNFVPKGRKKDEKMFVIHLH